MGVTLRELIYDAELGGGIANGRQLKAVIPGGSSVPVLTADQLDTPLEANAMAEAGSMLGSGAIIVIDDRCCMVQLGLRVAQFYMHESCGKCTPVPRGHPLDGADPELDRGGDGVAGRPRPAARRLRPDPRQVPLPARGRGGDAGGELHRQVPRRVPGAHRQRLPDGRRARRSRASSRRSTSTRTHRSPRCPRERAPRRETSRSRSTAARSRSRRGSVSSRRRRPRGSRSRSSATSRGSGRPSAPAGCASSRSRACRSCRPAAR